MPNAGPLAYFHYEEVRGGSFGRFGECPLCQGRTVVDGHSEVGREDERLVNARFCPACHYWELYGARWSVSQFGERVGFLGDRTIEARLESFPRIQNQSLKLSDSLGEIRGREDLLKLSPRQFEEFTSHYVRDLFDCEVTMTKQTRDGGYDLMCFDSEIGPFIVECKRYQKTKLGVDLVRQLAGVQLINDIPTSFIVTTGQPTCEALRERARLNSFTEYQMEIRDIDDLLDWLGKKIRTADNTRTHINIAEVLSSIGFGPVRTALTYDPLTKKLQLV
jgi:hypothetical protein